MARVATAVPDESDLLCEGCGYTLNGLPPEGNCPECGRPIEENNSDHRRRSPFERSPSPESYMRTLGLVLGGHRRFYLKVNTRSNAPVLKVFAQINMLIASIFFGIAAAGHLLWILGFRGFPIAIIFGALSWIFIFIMLLLLTKLAAWLSAIEARYWGMRLPLQVVTKGLQYHSADYLPVSIFAAVFVWIYQFLLLFGVINRRHDDLYLYSLCGIVILSAFYLFRTYWIAMRSMMFANR